MSCVQKRLRFGEKPQNADTNLTDLNSCVELHLCCKNEEKNHHSQAITSII